MRIALYILIGLCVVAAASAINDWDEPYWIEQELEHIMEDGTYGDFREFRDELGYDVLPWIDSLSDFRHEQRRHEDMQDAYEDRLRDFRRDLRDMDVDRRVVRRGDTVTVYKPDLHNPDVVHIITYHRSHRYVHHTIPRHRYVQRPYHRYKYRQQLLKYRYPDLYYR